MACELGCPKKEATRLTHFLGRALRRRPPPLISFDILPTVSPDARPPTTTLYTDTRRTMNPAVSNLVISLAAMQGPLPLFFRQRAECSSAVFPALALCVHCCYPC